MRKESDAATEPDEPVERFTSAELPVWLQQSEQTSESPETEPEPQEPEAEKFAQPVTALRIRDAECALQEAADAVQALNAIMKTPHGDSEHGVLGAAASSLHEVDTAVQVAIAVAANLRALQDDLQTAIQVLSYQADSGEKLDIEHVGNIVRTLSQLGRGEEALHSAVDAVLALNQTHYGPAPTAKGSTKRSSMERRRTDSSADPVRGVLRWADWDGDGHLSHGEFNHLQESCGQAATDWEPWRFLCRELGCEPSVGIHEAALAKLYQLSGSSAADDLRIAQQFDKSRSDTLRERPPSPKPDERSAVFNSTVFRSYAETRKTRVVMLPMDHTQLYKMAADQANTLRIIERARLALQKAGFEEKAELPSKSTAGIQQEVARVAEGAFRQTEHEIQAREERQAYQTELTRTIRNGPGPPGAVKRP
jgi:hypothetical protein